MIRLNSIVRLNKIINSAPLAKGYASKVIPLTKDRYSYLKRNPDYKSLDDSDIAHFKGILGEAGIQANLNDVDELESHNADWMGVYKGSSQCVLKPNSTQQVSEILKYCNDKK
jgi:D-lactate dehydrogenase (cytochrome)